MADPEELVGLDSFSRVARALFSSDTVGATLQGIVDLATQTVEGCDAAGVLVVEGGRASSVATSGPLAIQVEDLQVAAGEGPCLDAATSGTTFYAADLVDDARWLTFGPMAVAAGVRTVLAYALSDRRLSALNLYARLPNAFGVTERAQGELFATLARIALETAEERAAGDERAVNLTEALRTRELIGQAQGILMERERITADQAFDVLRRASQHLNRKLRDVAASLVESGEAPATGPVSPG